MAATIMVLTNPTTSNKTIYHYTSFDNFKSILESKSLWLSCVNASNDYSEFTYGLDNSHYKLLADPEIKEYGNLIEQGYCEAIKLKEGQKERLCAVSFCKKKNLLSQWRAYGNDGRGVSIGFDTSALKKICKGTQFNPKIRLYFGECCYNKDDQEKLYNDRKKKIKDILMLPENSGCLSIPEKLIPRFREESNKKHFKDNFLGLITVPLLFIKHKAFREEQEVRIASSPIPKNKLKRTGCICYTFGKKMHYELPLQDKENKFMSSLITKIYLGPAAEESKEDVKDLFKKAGLNPAIIEIEESEIPYKNNKLLKHSRWTD